MYYPETKLNEIKSNIGSLEIPVPSIYGSIDTEPLFHFLMSNMKKPTNLFSPCLVIVVDSV